MLDGNYVTLSSLLPMSIVYLILAASGGNAAKQKAHICTIKDSFITQDRNDDFEGGQVESTFS